MRNYLVIYALLVAFLVAGCTHDPEPIQVDDIDEITLIWHQAYPTETMQDVLLGLNWTYANLGALNTNNSTNGFQYNENQIKVNVSLLGLSNSAKAAITQLHNAIKKSEEYRKTGGIDLGRYATLLLGASQHYYKIMNVPLHLKDILKNYQLQPDQGYLDNSAIAINHRTISYSTQNGLNQLFVSVEIDSITKEVMEFETIELMENGHMRFGIFDADSNRLDVAEPSHSNAGKPAKCMWCHESKVSPLFVQQNDEPGYLTAAALGDTLIRFAAELRQKQLNLTAGIDFNEIASHYKMELLYITFQRPTALRLSLEWNMTVEEVEQRLSHLPRFTHPEFFYIGSGYIREDVEQFAPFQGLEVSTMVREYSVKEVNYID